MERDVSAASLQFRLPRSGSGGRSRWIPTVVREAHRVEVRYSWRQAPPASGDPQSGAGTETIPSDALGATSCPSREPLASRRRARAVLLLAAILPSRPENVSWVCDRSVACLPNEWGCQSV